jgi:hypothetical protein
MECTIWLDKSGVYNENHQRGDGWTLQHGLVCAMYHGLGYPRRSQKRNSLLRRPLRERGRLQSLTTGSAYSKTEASGPRICGRLNRFQMAFGGATLLCMSELIEDEDIALDEECHTAPFH